MQGFTEKIVGLMKSHNLFESQGGPIILSQVKVMVVGFSFHFPLILSFLSFYILRYQFILQWYILLI